MEIREAEINDAAAIARVHVDCWRTTYEGIVPEDYLAKLSYSQREGMWRHILRPGADKAYVYVAYEASGVVGFASGGPQRSGSLPYAGELYTIYILDTFQRKGLGHLLISRVAQRLLQEDMESMLVWVLDANIFRRFYEILGGRPIAVQTISIGNVELDEVAYAWDDLHTIADVRPSGYIYTP